MTLAVSLHSYPILLLFSSCLLYDLRNWLGHLLNSKYNNNNPPIPLMVTHFMLPRINENWKAKSIYQSLFTWYQIYYNSFNKYFCACSICKREDGNENLFKNTIIFLFYFFVVYLPRLSPTSWFSVLCF